MPIIHHERRELHSRIVYFGPQGCGKTTTIRHVYERTSREPAPPMAAGSPAFTGGHLRLATDAGPPAFAGDYLRLSMGALGGFSMYLHLLATSGAAELDRERLAIVGRADGVVFLADAAPGAIDANRVSYQELVALLATNGLDVRRVPLVLQVNKQDLPGAVEVPTVARALGVEDRAHLGSSALHGHGVFEGLKEIVGQVLGALKRSADAAPPAEG